MTDAQILSLSAAAVAVFLAGVFLARTERGRRLLFAVAAAIVERVGAAAGDYAVKALYAMGDRLLDRLGDTDPIAWQEIRMIRYDRETAGNPYSTELPY